jgi:hypothetical protein
LTSSLQDFIVVGADGPTTLATATAPAISSALRLNTIAISYDTTAAVDVTCITVATVPTSSASSRIGAVPDTSVIIVATITIANPCKTVIVIKAVTVFEAVAPTIAIAITVTFMPVFADLNTLAATYSTATITHSLAPVSSTLTV